MPALDSPYCGGENVCDALILRLYSKVIRSRAVVAYMTYRDGTGIVRIPGYKSSLHQSTGYIFTNHSQEHSLSYSPRFSYWNVT